MKMFLGEYSPNITEGSRIALPKKLRDQIESGEVVLSKGFEKCILVYDKQDWVEQAQKQVENLKGETHGFRTSDLERYLYSSALETSVDSQGRIVLPAELKKYAQINNATTVLGVGNHIEIWDKELWEQRSNKISVRLES